MLDHGLDIPCNTYNYHGTDVGIRDGSHLQQAIAEVLKYSGKASDLQLFLAKTANGAWLPDDDPVALQLEKGEIDDVRKVTTEEQLKATWTIQDVLIANNMTRRRAPKSRRIHVLVVVPDGAGGSASETSASSKMIKEIHAETVLKKRTFAHSQVSSSDWGKITNELNI
ncbi:hypothetical protein PC128_g19214 [Phytophthora cactorum]|nr:hypothetical protein PC128_g19214 [Phytophthora cactorum]